MSTQTRRGDRGLGKTAAGGNAGSYSTYTRAAAAPPPLAHDPAERARTVAGILKRAREEQDQATSVAASLQAHRSALAQTQLAATALQAFPTAERVVVYRDEEDGRPVWGVHAIQDRDGYDLPMTMAQRIELEAAFTDGSEPVLLDEHPGTGYGLCGSFAIARALENAEPVLDRGFVDTHELNGRDFSRVTDAARTQLGLVGTSRTRHDFEMSVLDYADDEDSDAVLHAAGRFASELYDDGVVSHFEHQQFFDAISAGLIKARGEHE